MASGFCDEQKNISNLSCLDCRIHPSVASFNYGAITIELTIPYLSTRIGKCSTALTL